MNFIILLVASTNWDSLIPINLAELTLLLPYRDDDIYAMGSFTLKNIALFA